MAIPDFRPINTATLCWSAKTQPLAQLNIASWLLDVQSLTAKLKNKYPDFTVKVQQEMTAKPHPNEAIFFAQLSPNIAYHHREVLLFGNDKPRVYARSVIPKTTATQGLLSLKNKPLGEALFNHPQLQRYQVEFAKTADNIWGRRTVFGFNHVPVLVYEFFLDVKTTKGIC